MLTSASPGGMKFSPIIASGNESQMTEQRKRPAFMSVIHAPPRINVNLPIYRRLTQRLAQEFAINNRCPSIRASIISMTPAYGQGGSPDCLHIHSLQTVQRVWPRTPSQIRQRVVYPLSLRSIVFIRLRPKRTTSQCPLKQFWLRIPTISDHLRNYTSRPGTLAPNAHILRITSKLFNIFVRPN